MDSKGNENVFKQFNLNSDVIKQASKFGSLASQVNSLSSQYSFVNNINTPIYKDASEVIEEEESDLREIVDFSDAVCKVCSNPINLEFYWYYLKNKQDKTRSLSVCCLNCLKDYYNSNSTFIDKYEIIEYSRCSAYFKCKELGNIRNKCERSKNLTAKDRFVPVFTNFCESAQAGVILSTYKMNEILKQFSEQSQEQLNESNSVLKASSIQNNEQYKQTKNMLEESSKESKMQFNITFVMTSLTILLTIVNIILAVMTYKNNDTIHELKILNTQITDVNKNLIDLKSQEKNVISNNQSNR